MKSGCLQLSDFRAIERFALPISKALIHVVEHRKSEAHRVARAMASWNQIYDADGMCPVHVSNSMRTAKLLGDTRDLPFLKDLLKAGLRVAEEDSIIVFTNSDIILHPETPAAISKHLQQVDCLSSFRISLDVIPENGSPEYWNSLGQPDFGRDLFAFRRNWLLAHWSDIPDFLVGEQEWDLVMACLVRIHNRGPLLEKTDLGTLHEESEMPVGYVLHTKHVGGWLSSRNKLSPAKLYNVALANKWYLDHNLPHFQL